MASVAFDLGHKSHSNHQLDQRAKRDKFLQEEDLFKQLLFADQDESVRKILRELFIDLNNQLQSQKSAYIIRQNIKNTIIRAVRNHKSKRIQSLYQVYENEYYVMSNMIRRQMPNRDEEQLKQKISIINDLKHENNTLKKELQFKNRLLQELTVERDMAISSNQRKQQAIKKTAETLHAINEQNALLNLQLTDSSEKLKRAYAEIDDYKKALEEAKKMPKIRFLPIKGSSPPNLTADRNKNQEELQSRHFARSGSGMEEMNM